MHVMVVSPEVVLFEGDAEMVVCRTADGDIAFLPGHTPLLGALGVASVRVITPDGETTAAVHGGFVEVANDRVIVLSDIAELPAEIDVGRARAAKERAEQALAADPDDEDAQEALARASLRLEVAGVGSTPSA
jgi:F-type H+-transporting ATPase subunit epsilon